MVLRPAVPIFQENENILNQRREEESISSYCIYSIYKYITIYVISILQYNFHISFKSLKWNLRNGCSVTSILTNRKCSVNTWFDSPHF